jgi:hypothetical protein
MKRLEAQVSWTKEEMMTVATNDTLSKSKRIQTLFDAGCTVKEIHVMMGVIYNHAYNVVSNYVIKNGIEVEKSVRAAGNNGRKAQIKAMLEDGMKIIDIQRELRCDYSQVWKVKQELFPKTEEEKAAEVAEAIKVIEEIAVVAGKNTKKGKGSK